MKYSVIVPVYNKNETINSAINSILQQTINDFEIIVVDDGSDIPVSSSIRDTLDNRITIIRQENGGVSSARNAGIKASQGEYICFLDADDLWLPNHLSEIDRLLNKYGYMPMIVTSHIEKLIDGTIRHFGNTFKDMDYDFVCDNLFDMLMKYSGSIINTNSVCINKQVFLQTDIRFVEGEIRGEDTDVWFRIALKNKVVFTKEETTVYRRELSTATRDTTFVYSWIFSERMNEIIDDSDICDKVKSSCILFLDRYWMTCVRESKLDCKDDLAKAYLMRISKHTTLRYWVTLAFAYVPNKVFKIAYRIIMRRRTS